MTHARHQLTRRRTRGCGPGVAGVAEILQVKVGASNSETRSGPVLLENAWTQRSSPFTGEDQSIRLIRCVTLQVGLK